MGRRTRFDFSSRFRSLPLATDLARRGLIDDTGAAFAEYALILAIVGAAISIAALTIAGAVANRVADVSPGTNAVAHVNGTVQSGEGAFLKPADMQVGRWYPIQFVAGPSVSWLQQQSEGLPLTPARQIFVSRKMRVRLLPDANFLIRSKSSELQGTGTSLSGTWAWDLQPLSDGNHTLIAVIDVLSEGRRGDYHVVNRYSRRVTIRVGVGTLQAVISDMRDAKTVGDAVTALFRSWAAVLLAASTMVIAALGLRRVIRTHRVVPVAAGSSQREQEVVSSDNSVD